MKYDILLLDQNAKFWLRQIKIRVVLKQMDLGNTLLGFEKCPQIITKTKTKRKQHENQNALSQIHLYLLNYILQDVLK